MLYFSNHDGHTKKKKKNKKEKGKKTMRSNSKEVIKKVNNHIVEFFDESEYDGCDTVEEKVKSQIDYMRIKKDSIYETCLRLVEGGTFLVYDHDILEFINSLELNNNSNKKFDNIETFNLYCMLVARQLEKIYNS